MGGRYGGGWLRAVCSPTPGFGQNGQQRDRFWDGDLPGCFLEFCTLRPSWLSTRRSMAAINGNLRWLPRDCLWEASWFFRNKIFMAPKWTFLIAWAVIDCRLGKKIGSISKLLSSSNRIFLGNQCHQVAIYEPIKTKRNSQSFTIPFLHFSCCFSILLLIPIILVSF